MLCVALLISILIRRFHNKNEYIVGEEIVGKVHITGGSVSQQIESIYLTLSTSYVREVDDKKVTATYDLERVRLTEPFSVEPNEKVEIPKEIR